MRKDCENTCENWEYCDMPACIRNCSYRTRQEMKEAIFEELRLKTEGDK